jgi:hypothetical protein
MTRPLVQIGDEVREMNDAEFAQYEIDAADAIKAEAAKVKQATEKAALLARLGLTEDELKTILG